MFGKLLLIIWENAYVIILYKDYTRLYMWNDLKCKCMHHISASTETKQISSKKVNWLWDCGSHFFAFFYTLYFSNFSTINIYYIYEQKIKTSICVYCLFITLIIRQDRGRFFQRAFPEFLRLDYKHVVCSLSLSYTPHQMLLHYTEIPKQQQKQICKGLDISYTGIFSHSLQNNYAYHV